MDSPITDNRSLLALRDQIDSLDNQLLELLATRMRVVSQVAEYKRAHGLQVLDVQRERELLERRRVTAERLNLPGTVVESIYRLIMLASRDRQTTLHVLPPTDADTRTVAIIGGAGPMGKVLERILVQAGQRVLVADLETSVTPRAAAQQADVVVICVPIDVTEKVIRELGPHVRPDGLLMDVTSIKQEPIAWMLASTQASVVGTHPLFGPSVHLLQGQRVVVCPARGEVWHQWVLRTLAASGLVVTEATPEQHDRAMAMVQVLTHFQTQVLGFAMTRLGIGIEESLRFTSPAYLLELYAAARHFTQSPQLYGPIEMRNPMGARVTQVFCDAANALKEILDNHDQAKFNAMFDEVRRFFGSFTEEAQEQSGFLIDRLVERSLGTIGS